MHGDRDGDSGDERRARFEAVYAATYQAILGYVLRRVDEPADAADLVAETFLTAWRRIDDVPAGADARPWLFRVARGVLANHRRGARRRLQLADRLRVDLQRHLTTISGRGEDDPHAGLIAAAFRRLSDSDREVLGLVAWEGLERDEVATVLQCSRTSVRVRLHRARRRFARELRQQGIDPQPHRIGGDLISRRVSARPGTEELR